MKMNKALFSSGCFWGTQHHFDTHEGVVNSLVGYTGGSIAHPTYEQVCSGDTGHREAIEVEFDPSVTTYEALVKLFFETHNFSQVGGQGPDIGHQYTSAIYYLTDEQKNVAEKLVFELAAKGFVVTTEIIEAETFYPAEEYHQKYYEKSGGVPYCHVYIKRFD
tara:strand:+ start:2678 stop:3166 length:489 start_codon:yes stop_codon:yes gene_type:complete